jgi:hypothetical protein
MDKYTVEEFRNYLLMMFNDYSVPLQMTAEEVRDYIEEFYNEFIETVNKNA